MVQSAIMIIISCFVDIEINHVNNRYRERGLFATLRSEMVDMGTVNIKASACVHEMKLKSSIKRRARCMKLDENTPN